MIPATFVSCTFSQRVFAEIHTFSSEFLVEPYVFLWMSLLREIFCTTFSKTSHTVDTTRARATLCAQSCVWIATSRCPPNNSKLREQCSPRSLFDVNFSKRLFGLCGRYLLLVKFHIVPHIVPSFPHKQKSPAHTKAACAGSFFYPRGLSNTSRM